MPPPAKGGETATGKTDDHHRPNRRFRRGGQRGDLYGRKDTILRLADRRENSLRGRILLPADTRDRKRLRRTVENIVDVQPRRAEAVRSVVRYVAAEREKSSDGRVRNRRDSRWRRLENES